MNLVQQIIDQVLGSGLAKLSLLTGESEAKTESAVAAVVPALLSGFSNLASTSEGAQKLMLALGKFDADSLENLGGLLTEHAGSLAEKGSSLLSWLLGENVLSGLISVLARFTDLDGGSAKSLLGFLTPLVLGGIAKQFAGKSITAQELTNLFGCQKANIASALPAGLSLTDVPGLSSLGSATRATYGAAQKSVFSFMKWLPPLIGLAALALVAYLDWTNYQPALPEEDEFAQVSKDLTDNFASLSDTISGIKDAASSEAALPMLTALTGKLDGMKPLIDELPGPGRYRIGDLVKSSMGKFLGQFTKVLMVPGVSDKLRPILEALFRKIASLAGQPPGQFRLPSVKVTSVGSDLAGSLGSLTETLTGVKDAASANFVLPKLREIGSKFGAATGSWKALPDVAKATIGSALKPAIANLELLVDKILAIPDVGDKLKPVLGPIMNELASLGSWGDGFSRR